jgi:NADH:ubiquinone oxidoreductase subunit 5 (subunit L)/multisubunit Na+/H+ antiporter MnhA subunit
MIHPILLDVALILSVAAPFLGAALSPLAYRAWGRTGVVVPVVSALLSLVSLLSLLPVAGQTPAAFEWPWVDALSLSFAFRVDGFGGLFALLVAGMGFLIVCYAHFYMEREEGNGRFFAFLLFFFGSMLGVALSDHFFTTFLFWELTSVSSFLLIGFWHAKEKSREGALKALFITSIGGLFLMAGLALLGAKTGVWHWSALSAIDPNVTREGWFVGAFLLILVGVFTKSAQVPFHIWLPDAMEAPTPVSAFLHSATMVKAGVFLLFRLFPLFSLSALWVPTLVTVGITTAVTGAVLALKQRDLKAMLAYSTISQLGLFVALHGYAGVEASFASVLRVAFIFHIFVHAFYKGSLFLLTGIVDHAAHTRDIGKVGLLARSMPRTSVFLVLSAASMAGLPPFLGFLSKESVLDVMLQATRLSPWGWIPLAGLALSAAITVAVALKISIGLVFLKPAEPGHIENNPPHDPSWLLLWPPALLSVVGLIFGLFPGGLTGLLYPIGLSGLPVGQAPSFSLWHGVNGPLLISVGAFLAGGILFHHRSGFQHFQNSCNLRWTVNSLYAGFWVISVNGAKRVTDIIQNGSLTRYSAVLVGFLSLVCLGTVFVSWRSIPFEFSAGNLVSFESISVVGLVVSSLLVVILKDTLARIISLGAVGILMCAFFALRGAPDLALTGFLVEIVMFIVIVLVLNQLRPEKPVYSSTVQKIPRAALAGLGGAVLGLLVFVALENPLAPSIHSYFNENSAALAGGLNVVNVILVDFRGFDTLGEILVLCLAGLGVFGLRRIWTTHSTHTPVPREFTMQPLPPSPILTAISAICFPIIMIFAIYITLKGHNEPGGGFIGGLVCAGGLTLEMLAIGRGRFLRRLPVRGGALFGIGLALAFGVGLAAMILGAPFLTSAVFPSIHFSTAALFDVGVFFVVVGVTLEMITVMEDETHGKAAR